MISSLTECPTARRARYVIWIAAMALCLAIFTLSALPNDSLAGSADATELPADLALVPATATGFVTFRVADLWGGPLAKTLREKLTAENADLAEGLSKEFPKIFEAFTGVPITEVERLTLVPADVPGAEYAYLIVAAKQPLKRDSVLSTLDGEGRKERGGATYWARGGRRLRFVNDRTLLIVAPDYPPPSAPSANAPNPLKEALRLAAANHPIAGGLVPSAYLERYGGMMDNPLVWLAISTHPLALARNAVFTLDVSPTSPLELRLAYRKEATAAVAEEALETALQAWRRDTRRQLGGLPAEADRHGDTGLLWLLLGILERVKVEQRGTEVRADVNLNQDAALLVSEAIRRAGISTRRTQDANNLKQLALAMHNYHDTYMRFPPPALKSKEGKPLLSWRVLLLPYMEESDLYSQFKLDEPWDSPHNKPLLSRMPKTFVAPTTTKDPPFTTRYQVLVGGGALFEPDRKVRIMDILDGTSNTIMIAEAAEPVPWTKPADLVFTPNGPLPRFAGVVKDRFSVAMADGTVQFIPSDTSADTLRAMITKAGGETFEWPGVPRSDRQRPVPGWRKR